MLTSGKANKLKLTQLIGDYLIENRSVSLPGFGLLMYDSTIRSIHDTEAGVSLFAQGSLSFRPDSKADYDEELILFISKESGKMRSLSYSDLDSYFQFGHELINISKPFNIEGIGTLQKTPKNELEFIQEIGTNLPYHQSKGKKKIRPRDSFGSGQSNIDSLAMHPKRNMATNKILIVAVVLLTIAVAYLLNSKFHILGKRFSTDFNNSIPQKSNEGILSDATTETTATETTQPDATKGNFNVILEVAKKDRAFKRYTELKVWGHDIRMETEDSLRFKLFIPILAPIADTTRHKDSLRLFFDKNVWIEIPADE
jgi:hypothetical protein